MKMLNRKSLSVLILVLGIIMPSCQKDGEGGLIRSKMSATIDGTTWTATLPVAESYKDKIVISGVSMSTTGTAGATVTITVFGDSEGSYSALPLSTGKKGNVTYKKTLTTSTDDAYTSITGTIVVDKIDKTSKRISGTFQVTVINTDKETLSIENGVFTNVVFDLVTQ